MKKTFLLTIFLLFVSLPVFADYQKLDGIVAIVDEDVITQSDISQKLALAEANMSRQEVRRRPSEEELRQQVLDRLIIESLQLQMARRAGIRVSDEQLNQAMSTIARRNGFELAEFRDELASQGIAFEDMREQVREEIMIQQVQQGYLRERIQISDREVENFLASAEGRNITRPRYHLTHVLLPLDENASADKVAQANARLADIRYKVIHNDLAFRELMTGNPYPELNLSGTDFGWREVDELPSLFADIALTMERGEISEPIRSGAGWHLLRLLDSTASANIVEQTRARHILVQPSEVRSDAQALALAQSLHQRALDGEDFGLLAREYSQDKGSALQGGDLNWRMLDEFDPAFKNALKALDVDEISQPVQSSYGWHIIQKTGVRKHDMTRENQKERAYQALYERKFGDALESWLVSIREEAFVEIK